MDVAVLATDDAGHALAIAGPYLASDPVQHNSILTLLHARSEPVQVVDRRLSRGELWLWDDKGPTALVGLSRAGGRSGAHRSGVYAAPAPEPRLRVVPRRSGF